MLWISSSSRCLSQMRLSYLEVLAIQPFYSSDGTQRECKTVATGSSAVGLTGKSLRGGRAGTLGKASWSCREAHVGF